MRVGFVGLGMMGNAMANNLIKGGHEVAGYDISEQALAKLKENGGTPTKSLAEVAKDADVVFTMLPNSSFVENAVCGPDGLGSHMKPGSILVDCSTILPETTVRVGKWLKEKGIRCADAPVGRTSADAITGTLIFMVGANKEDYDFIYPCLDCMGEIILHCGPLGTGIGAKIINNYMSCTLNVLTAESLALGDSLGLNRDTLLEVLRGTPAGRGHINTTYPAKVFKGDISPAFMLELAAKDVGLAMEVAAQQKVPFFTGAGARQAYTLAKNQGFGREDWTAMLPAIKRMSNLETTCVVNKDKKVFGTD